jgi:chromosome partitioning protein
MILSIANQKGGVAKTTTAINLAAGLSVEGYKVLLIDADPQTNATQVFIHPDNEISPDKSLYNVMLNFAPLSGVILDSPFPNLSVVPSHIRLSGVDLELAQAFDNRSARLKKALEPVRDRYDYIVIDNPPSLGLITINSFVASDKLIIPVSTAFFALSGLVQLQETIGMVKQAQLNPNLDIMGVVCTFSDRTNVSTDVEQQLRDYFGNLVFETTIPKNVALEEAHSNYSHIFDHAPNSAGAIAYKSLVHEVLKR